MTVLTQPGQTGFILMPVSFSSSARMRVSAFQRRLGDAVTRPAAIRLGKLSHAGRDVDDATAAMHQRDQRLREHQWAQGIGPWNVWLHVRI